MEYPKQERLVSEASEKERAMVAKWERYRLSDRGMLLAVMYGAEVYGGPMDIELPSLETYAYLLREESIVPFNYHFQFEPLPASGVLQEDARGLVHAGYLQSRSPLHVTSKGRQWAKEHLADVEGIDTAALLSSVAEALGEYEALGQDELFRRVYALLSA